MSVARSRLCTVKYRFKWEWSLDMISWYRQVLSLVYGLGVMLIALWAINQGQGPWMILGVVGMSCLTLLLIFGVEIDTIKVGDKVQIDFTDTTQAIKEDE